MNKLQPVAIEIRDLSFKYPLAEKQILNHINLTIRQGEYVIISGPTGSGKTTLALCLNGIIPHLMEGDLVGDVIVNNLKVAEHPVHEMTPQIGMVFQNPEDQLFSLNVIDEVAFGVENMGYAHAEIVERVDRAIQQVHLGERQNYSIFKLSGGQKQKVAIASNLAIMPDILVLDAPTADLDPVSAAEVVNTLVELRQQAPKRTFIVINSDISDVVHLATRLIVLNEGEIVLDGAPKDLLQQHFSELVALGVRIPDHVRLMHWLSQQYPDLGRFEIEEQRVRELMDQLFREHRLALNDAISQPTQKPKPPQVIVSLKDVSFKFENGPTILEHTNLEIQQGEWIAIIGENGTGKSTVMKLISGLLKPQSGQIETSGVSTLASRRKEVVQDVGYLFQNPDHQLFMSSVEEEISFSPRRQGYAPEELKQRVDEALHLMGLEAYRNKHPFTLSRGQRQRLAVATVLAARPKLLLLDEPTTGQDQIALENLMQLVRDLIEAHGTTVVMVTHDMDLVAQYASRVIVLSHGQVLLDGTPGEVFGRGQAILETVNLKPPRIVRLTSDLKYGSQVISTCNQALEWISVS
jgi:energy-coupling factor transport system ATP-binding protein